MDILKTREQLRSCSIYDLPLRVTFYARVSTEKDAQLNSFDNQISFYSNMIKKNPNWEYARVTLTRACRLSRPKSVRIFTEW